MLLRSLKVSQRRGEPARRWRSNALAPHVSGASRRLRRAFRVSANRTQSCVRVSVSLWDLRVASPQEIPEGAQGRGIQSGLEPTTDSKRPTLAIWTGPQTLAPLRSAARGKQELIDDNSFSPMLPTPFPPACFGEQSALWSVHSSALR